MKETSKSFFIFKIDQVFRFSDGSTVFIGEFSGNQPVDFPCQADLLQDDYPIAEVRLEGYRMGGPKLSPSQRVIYTRTPLSFDILPEDHRYKLVSKQLVRVGRNCEAHCGENGVGV